MLTQITKKNISNFNALAPKRELMRLENDENCFGIGYADDAESLPDGVLIFYLDEEMDDEGEPYPIAVISYFYVRESARDMYVGAYLFSNLLEMSKFSGIEAIRCDVPMGFEYNLLCNTLESFGFHFDLVEVFEFERPLKDFKDLPALKKAPKEGALMLYEITQAEFLRGFKKLISQEEFYEYELSGDMESYDTELSTVIMENGVPIGLFLVRQDSDGCLVPLFLKAGDSNSSILTRLLYESLQAALAKYGKQATVRITLRSSRGTKLLGALFPDFSPFIVRRGYFYV